MKSLLLTISKRAAVLTTLAFLVIAPLQPLIAQAQDAGAFDQSGSAGTGLNTGVGDAGAFDQSGSAGTPLSGGSGSAAPTNPAAQSSANGGTPTSNCSIWGNGSLNPFSKTSGGDLAQCFTDVIYVFTIGIGSGFAYVAAYFFDWSVALSLNGTAYALDFVSQGWTTARDIANMAFLFILLYIAFKIMFQAETNETVHMLSLVIVIALLVNFSFFFTRLAIDAGNILAIQFYNAIDVPPVGSSTQGQGVQATAASATVSTINYVGGGSSFSNSKDLTAGIMGMLNLQGLLSNDSFQAYRNGPNYNFLTSLITLSFLYISAGIMLWLLTVAFVTNGVKFLIRIVVLWFLIIASPLAFVARAVPKFEEYYKKWQNALIQHAFYPVAFMFIFLILTNFAKQMGAQNALINGIFNGADTRTASSMVAGIGYAVANVGIRMGFVLAMLYIGMEASKRIGVMGADAANHAGDWVGNRFTGAFRRTGGAAIGTVGVAGRNTFGLGASGLANATWAKRLESRTGAAGLFGRGLRATAGAVGRASFDVRGTPVLGKALGDSLGKAQKGGYDKSLEESIKAKEKRGKALEPTDGQKMVAREQAETETGVSEQKKKYEEAKTRHDEVSARLQDMKDRGEGETDMARGMEVSLKIHKNAMAAAQARMTILKAKTDARAKEISGEGLKKEYAKTLMTPNIRNLWNVVSLPPGKSWRGSTEAAAKLRKEKSDVEKIADAVKEAAKEEKEEKTKESDTGKH